MEVLATLSVRIVSIPTGSHGSKHLDVILVVAWIEQQGVGATYLNGLEKSIVGRSLHWSLEDIPGLDVLLVAVDHLSYCHVHGVTFHLVFVSHRRVCSLYEDGFRRVNREVDGLVGNTQAIELRRNRVHGIFFESEGTVFAQLHRVYFLRTVQTDILQVEHGVLGFSNVAVDMKFLVMTRSESQRSNHDHCH